MTDKTTKENAAASSVEVTRRRFLQGAAAGLGGATVAAPYVITNYATASAPIELTLSSSCCTETSAQGSLLKFWGDEMERRTDGEVKAVQYAWSGSLTKWSNQVKSIGSGICEAGDIANNSVAGLMPLTIALEPVFKYEGYAQGYFHGRSYNEFPELQAEFERVKVVPIYWQNGANGVLHTSITINSIDDLKGRKIRVSGPHANQCMKNMGGLPVGIPATEVAQSMQKGIVDGAVFPGSALKSLGMAEADKQVTNFRAGCYDMWVGGGINVDVYNKFSDIAKRAVEDLAAIIPDRHRKLEQKEILAGLELAAENGVDIAQLTREESARWNKLINPESIYDVFIKKAEEAGQPNARKYMEKVIAWQDEWEAENPFRNAFEIYAEKNPGAVRIIG